MSPCEECNFRRKLCFAIIVEAKWWMESLFVQDVGRSCSGKVPFVPIVVEGDSAKDIKSFYMGKFPVTQREWTAIMGNNPSIIMRPNGWGSG